MLIHYRVMINASINAAPSAEAEPAEASTGGDPPCQVNGSSHPSSASPAFRDAHCDEEQELQRKLALCDEERELEQKLTLLERRIRAHRELIITQAFGPLAGQFDLPIAPMETDIHLTAPPQLRGTNLPLEGHLPLSQGLKRLRDQRLQSTARATEAPPTDAPPNEPCERTVAVKDATLAADAIASHASSRGAYIVLPPSMELCSRPADVLLPVPPLPVLPQIVPPPTMPPPRVLRRRPLHQTNQQQSAGPPQDADIDERDDQPCGLIPGASTAAPSAAPTHARCAGASR